MEASKKVVRNRQVGFALLFLCAFSTYLNVGLIAVGLLNISDLVWVPSEVLGAIALVTGLAGGFYLSRRSVNLHLPAMA
ncbi:hypothetical protein BKK79_28465 [Cupriavidus sp. USMAA2-4]|uniref:Uncharacterized protein n=1 Tax=Cupriavidus malaysiensis TaxID=367825 RepID=A0ABN4TVA2_9BURK|nr:MULTISPECIES: hypothetical protein [Cupriavidus]AOY95651.1 hypothetical protein BKK79_28465 [Cupriavidus sp. USMAA2-4]AOZ01469.1 hypothetical protein BKK81_18775 [Cupriavidus sp. USMAHM13]AOZ08800.1 hypothetical protein BKK80_23160 [Cupriavidus malaysiensis]